MEEEEQPCQVCQFIALNRAEFRHHMMDKHNFILLKDKHQINIKDIDKFNTKDKHKTVLKTFQDHNEDNVAPAVEFFSGNVKEKEEISEFDMNNDFEEYDNEMDDNEVDNDMESDDGKDNGLDIGLDNCVDKNDEIVDDAKDDCLKKEVGNDIWPAVDEFTCETCFQTFELATQLIKHVKISHSDEKGQTFSCKICQKSFSTKQWLSRHMGKEHTEKSEQNIPEKRREKHQCHICQKQLFFAKILQNHIEKEHDQESYQCSQCQKTYVTKSKFKDHQARAHIGNNNDPSKQVMCEICSKIFGDSKRLRQHIQFVHEKSFKNKFCEPCNKEFTPSNYWHHMKSVHLDKAHTCEKCGKSFMSKHCLAKHFNAVHEKLKPFICHLCGKGFPNPTNLQQHIDAIHKKLKPYLCKLCGKFYSLHTGLSVHLKNVHKIEKPNVTLADRVIK